MGSVGPGTLVAAVGAGAIGILAVTSAQAMGVEDVALEARHPHQFEARDLIGAVAPSGHYDIVLETGESESSLYRSVELACPGGTVVYMGVFGDITWPHACAHDGRREFAEAADMLAGRPELAQTLITHRFPLEDAPEAFRVARDKSKGVFRVVIEP
jgi:threonine dehydrogenase-like Zn-dependent dehydrogenase